MTNRDFTSINPLKQPKIKIGDVFDTNNGGSVTVLKFINCKNINIVDNDNGYKCNVTASNLRNGKIKNPFRPSVYGVGFIGLGLHKSRIGKHNTLAYSYWFRMIRRCYDPKSLNRNVTYVGCTVCKDWHNFQNFADWFYSQKFFDMNYHLDKDIINKGNKIYSALNCCLVPPEINGLIVTSKVNKSSLGTGVKVDKIRNKLVAYVSIGGEKKYLGTFGDKISARKAYLLAKKNHINSVAIANKGRIDDPVFNALMSWDIN